jgi:hypothetical protein
MVHLCRRENNFALYQCREDYRRLRRRLPMADSVNKHVCDILMALRGFWAARQIDIEVLGRRKQRSTLVHFFVAATSAAVCTRTLFFLA